MKIEQLQNIDPQVHVTVRFGRVETDDGGGAVRDIMWDMEWQHVRILTMQGGGVHGGGDGAMCWYMTPLSLDGRPMGLTFEGHTGQGGIFGSPDTPHVMQVLNLAEPYFLRKGVEAGDDVPSVLLDHGMVREDLTEIGRAIYDACVGDYGVSKEFLNRLLDIADGVA